jgi:hypothetical protein
MQNQNTSKENPEIVETTVGDLIEAITDIALEAGKTEEEGYRLASMTLERILSRQLKNEAAAH